MDEEMKGSLYGALENVIDPELGVDIVNLGLVYDVNLDEEGTLLTDEKVISEKTAHTLKQAREQGHQVMIATGRPYRASEIYYKQLDLITPIVNFNGAFVHHPKDVKWKTIHETISLPVVRDVIDAMQDFAIHNIIAEVMDDVYLEKHDAKLLDILS